MKLLEGAPLPGRRGAARQLDTMRGRRVAAAAAAPRRTRRRRRGMGRTPMIAGNWKMYKTAGRGRRPRPGHRRARRATCWDERRGRRLPAVHRRSRRVSTVIELDKLADRARRAERALGGGGRVHRRGRRRACSPTCGCDYCIVGHSERREYLRRDRRDRQQEGQGAASRAGITPIMCCGETLDDARRGRDRHASCASRSARASTGSTAEQAAQLVIAYEPIWAIGTGRTPTPEAANDVCRVDPRHGRRAVRPAGRDSGCASCTAARSSPRTSRMFMPRARHRRRARRRSGAGGRARSSRCCRPRADYA